MEDVLGDALKDYQQNNRTHKLWIHNKYGNKEEMPIATYFRNIENMSQIELLALEGCTGDVLNVGSGAGCHSLILQQRKLNVTSIDISAGASTVMRQLGINNIVTGDIFSYKKKKFDTLLFLMNGMGIAGTLNGLEKLLHALTRILKPAAHILFDSSEVHYLYEQLNLPQHYYGEIDYRYEYNCKFSNWFKWLYIDKLTMQQSAVQCGFKLNILMEDKDDLYLGRLTRI